MKLYAISLAASMILLQGCGTTVYKTQVEVYCPTLIEYPQEFSNGLADELEAIPDEETKKTTEAISDYVALRDEIRACIKQRDK